VCGDSSSLSLSVSIIHFPFTHSPSFPLTPSARVMSMDQISGMEPLHENWGDVHLGEDIDEAGDPPRVWSKYGEVRT